MLLCTGLGVTKNASLVWVVDGILYNSTGNFSSSRGWIMVERSLDTINCKISLSLTLLNVQSNSQGVYTCIVSDHDFTASKNTSLTLHMDDSTEGLFCLNILVKQILAILVKIDTCTLLLLDYMLAILFKHHQTPGLLFTKMSSYMVFNFLLTICGIDIRHTSIPPGSCKCFVSL